jgi:hypothetical protein
LLQINEAIDLLAEDILSPPIQQGEYPALLNVGGYGWPAAQITAFLL